MLGLPAKYAKMGFSKGWKAYRKSKQKPTRKARKRKNKITKTKTRRTAIKRRVSGKIARFKTRKQKGATMAKGKRGLNVMNELQSIGIGAAGAVGGTMIGNAIPIADPRLKAIMPLIAGILLSGFGKSAMLKKLAYGMSIGGALSTIKAIAPNIPMLAGEESAMQITPSDIEQAVLTGAITPAQGQALLSSPEFMGLSETYAGEEEEDAGGIEFSPADEWETQESEM